MTYRPMSALVAVSIIALSGTPANAQTPQQVKTEKNKSLILGNFMNAPSNCGTNPGPLPLPILREKPAHGTIGLQIVIGDVAPKGRQVTTSSARFVGDLPLPRLGEGVNPQAPQLGQIHPSDGPASRDPRFDDRTER